MDAGWDGSSRRRPRLWRTRPRTGRIAQDGDGANSPFAAAPAQHLTEPGVEVGKLFRLVRDDVLDATGKKQEPFVYGSLPGRQDFYFQPLARAGGTPSEGSDPIAAAKGLAIVTSRCGPSLLSRSFSLSGELRLQPRSRCLHRIATEQMAINRSICAAGGQSRPDQYRLRCRGIIRLKAILAKVHRARLLHLRRRCGRGSALPPNASRPPVVAGGRVNLQCASDVVTRTFQQSTSLPR